MNTLTIRHKISRGIELKKIIANLEDELKQIKADLVTEAEGRHEEHQPTPNGGWSWRHADHDDNIVCVSQPARKMKSKIDPESTAFARIRSLAGRAFAGLFTQVPAYKPVEEFTVKALQHLDGVEAKKLIKLVTTESPAQVAFEVAQEAA